MEYGKVAGIDKPVSRMVFGTDRLRSRRLSWLPDWGLEHEAYSLLDRSFKLGPVIQARMQLIRHGAHMSGQRTDARPGSGNARTATRLSSSARGATPPLGKAAALSRLMCGTIFTRPLRRSALMSSICFFFTTTTPNARVQPVMERLNRHIDEGKITAIGASNFAMSVLTTRNAVAAGDGRKPSCASSVQFSVADWTRSPWPGAVKLEGERQCAARDWYSTNGLSVFAWSRLARGFFSNHYDPQNTDHNPVSRWCATYFGAEENNQRRERALMFARDHDVTVAQVALAYVLSHPLSVFAVVGCTTHDNLVHDAGSSSLKLDEETLRWLATGRNSQ